jgi:hypothetical protein
MRAALELLLLSLVTFAAAFVIRWMFLWDVKPVSWDYEPPSNGALDAAFLLLSIENIAAVVAAISVACLGALLIKRWRLNPARRPGDAARTGT